MWSLLREISFRHFRQSPLRTSLVIFGIALGVSMLSAVLAANDSLLRSFEDMVDRVAGKADLTVAAGSAGIPSALTGELADMDGVAHAAAMVEVVTRTVDGAGGSLLVLGVDFLGDTFFLPFAQPGEHQVIADPLAFVNDPRAVLVSKKFAAARKLVVGGELPLLTPQGAQTFVVRGLLEDEGPAASFGGQVVVMFIDALQGSFGRGYLVDRIDVVVAEGKDVAALEARIRERVKGMADVERPATRSARLVRSLWAFRNGLNASGLAAMWVGMFLIYNAVSISVAQRRREVGTLRALGLTRARVTQLFCLEAMVMAVFGCAVGLWLGGLLSGFALEGVAGTINQFVLPIRPPPPELTWSIGVSSVAAGLGTTLLAAYIPARASARIDPAESLRSTRASSTLRTLPERKLSLLGAVLVGLAFVPAWLGGESNGYLASTLVVVGLTLFVPLVVRELHRMLVRAAELSFGIPGRIALDNVERSIGRSAMTVISLMLAVSMSVTIATYARSFERSMLDSAEESLTSDAFLTAGSPMLDRLHIPFAPSLLDKLKAVPGLRRVNPIRLLSLDVGTRRAEISALDTFMYFDELHRHGHKRRVVDGPSEIDPRALVDTPRVVISENLATANKLSAGDKLELNTPVGIRSFTVHAVVVDYSSDQGFMLMDLKWYREYFQDEQVDAADLFFTPGTQFEPMAERIRAQLSDTAGLFVTSHEGQRAQLRAVAASTFALARAPEVITLLVALMGVIGTMLAAVIDRIREIGMLRAIGATRRQMVTSMVVESAFLGLASAVCGIIAGIPQGYLFLKVTGVATSGWNLPYGFPIESAVRVSLEIICAAALAGLLPGLRAARLDVKDALAYD